MIVYFIRHAPAEEAAASGSDADRALTPEGVKKFRRAAKGFLSLDPEVAHVLASPLLRARQTAEILADALAQDGHPVEVALCPPLGPGGTLKGLIAQIAALPKGNVAAVGHEPVLSSWVGELCFGGAGRCEMKKGAVAAMEVDDPRGRTPRGTLLYLLQPAQLRAL